MSLQNMYLSLLNQVVGVDSITKGVALPLDFLIIIIINLRSVSQVFFKKIMLFYYVFSYKMPLLQSYLPKCGYVGEQASTQQIMGPTNIMNIHIAFLMERANSKNHGLNPHFLKSWAKSTFYLWFQFDPYLNLKKNHQHPSQNAN